MRHIIPIVALAWIALSGAAQATTYTDPTTGQQSPGTVIENGTPGTPAGTSSNPVIVSVSSGGGTVIISPVTHGQTAALAANLVLKASAGKLYNFQVSADSTLAGAAWWVMVYDAAAAPADGAVTPALCYAMPLGATVVSISMPAGGTTFATGIVVGASTSGCFSKTASAHAFISGGYL